MPEKYLTIMVGLIKQTAFHKATCKVFPNPSPSFFLNFRLISLM